MQHERPESHATQAWEALAQVYAASRQLSADQLIEWPAQLKMCGTLQGKRVLDVGCGTGDKARFFAEHGAAEVVGIDPSQGFAPNWKGHAGCPNLSFALGSFENLATLPAVASRNFDLIVCFQALMYAASLAEAVQMLRSLLAPCGELVISVPHPFRFAILRHEIEGWGHGWRAPAVAPTLDLVAQNGEAEGMRHGNHQLSAGSQQTAQHLHRFRQVGRIHQRLEADDQIELPQGYRGQRSHVFKAAQRKGEIRAAGVALPVLSEALAGIDADHLRGAMLRKKTGLIASPATHIQNALALKCAAHFELSRPFDELIGGDLP